MKILMALLLTLLLATSGIASNFWYGGAKYDSEDKWTLHGGRALQLSGGLYSLPGVELDLIEGVIAFKTVGIDFVYLWHVKGELWAGPVASPGVDWETNPPGNPISYITGAAGAVVCYNFEQWGISAAGRYKAGMDSFDDGWQVWGGLILAIGD